MKTVHDIKLKNKRVIIRVDYNVSFEKVGGKKIISDDTRIRQSLGTLKYVIEQSPRSLVLMSHLGDPNNSNKKDFSLDFVAEYLAKKLKKRVNFLGDENLKASYKLVKKSKEGEIFLLENVRFWKGEKVNQKSFGAKLAQFGDVFVNDGFGSCHRAHASVVGVAEFLPSVAGLLLEKEIKMIDKALNDSKHPFVVVLGGAKATTKIPMIKKLMTKADYMLLGGGVANTFLKALDYQIGRSIYSPESIRLAQGLLWKAARAETKVYLPSDVVVGNINTKKKWGEALIEKIPVQGQALDIGIKTRKDYVKVIKQAKTIIWNGPMGANEIRVFSKGTESIYKAIVENKKALSVVGGGDTLSSISGKDHLSAISHISTGGGAMLEYIEQGELPGIMALDK